MRFFDNPGCRLALDRDAATRIFQNEFHKSLDALDEELPAETWMERVPHVDEGVAMLAHQQLSRINAIWHQSLDETPRRSRTSRSRPIHRKARC